MSIRKSDYENYDYREFWEDDKRYYEDQSERIALRSMLRGEKSGDKLFIDIGCGYGRLFNEYSCFSRMIVIDYSIKNLKNARLRIKKYLAGSRNKLPEILFISADATKLPLRSDSADAILTVRVVHHLENPEMYFDEVGRILKNDSLYLLEFANKRNLKNILRFFIGRMDVSPFNSMPSQIGETIQNYHPRDIYKKLKARNIEIRKIISVSNFRLNLLKKIFGNKLLILFEGIYQKLFSFITWGPSIFVKGYIRKVQIPGSLSSAVSNLSSDTGKLSPGPGKPLSGSTLEGGPPSFKNILICPDCHEQNLATSKDKIDCPGCGRSFALDDGIIDFKASI